MKREPLLAMAAQAICGNCVVIEECRREALTMPHLQTSGVIGGVFATQIRSARRWRNYEEGASDVMPTSPRPEWLTTSDAANAEQRRRQKSYPSRSQGEAPDAAEASDTVQATTPAPGSSATRRRAKPKVIRHSLDPCGADVPSSIDGANCAAMPGDLVERYFKVNVQYKPAAAALAKLVCNHCVVLNDCRNHALNASNLPSTGVIAGLGVAELRRGRTWLRYESGSRDALPRSPRPGWLPQTTASETGGLPRGQTPHSALDGQPQ